MLRDSNELRIHTRVGTRGQLGRPIRSNTKDGQQPQNTFCHSDPSLGVAPVVVLRGEVASDMYIHMKSWQTVRELYWRGI